MACMERKMNAQCIGMKTLRKGDHLQDNIFFKSIGWKVVCWGMWCRTGTSSGLLFMVLNVWVSHSARNVRAVTFLDFQEGNLLRGVSYGPTDTKVLLSCKHNWSWQDNVSFKKLDLKGLSQMLTLSFLLLVGILHFRLGQVLHD